jgi:methyltransferase (TIGR00027 family)
MEGVGRTSLGVARVRAWESRRPDRLFDDPYAAAFAAAAEPDGAAAETESGAGSAEAAESERPGAAKTGESAARGSFRARLAYHVIIRTRFYDDYLLAACEAGCRQVVLLAAGLDTRAYRLPWPDGVHLYELDLPEVLSFKEGVLTEQGAVARCTRTTLATDLREDWPARLAEAGHDATSPTVWLIEGLLVYLSAEETTTVLTRAGARSAPGSRLSLERNNATTTISAEERAELKDYTSLWKGGLGSETEDWLSQNGWQVETHDLTEIAASYGRPTDAVSTSGFLTATYAPAH